MEDTDELACDSPRDEEEVTDGDELPWDKTDEDTDELAYDSPRDEEEEVIDGDELPLGKTDEDADEALAFTALPGLFIAALLELFSTKDIVRDEDMLKSF